MENFDYIKRDIAWLSFNHRVLQEAKDPMVPLYERIKFLAIYSSNLDEFFRVRVASLKRFKDLNKKTKKAIEVQPKKELKNIRQTVQKQQDQFGRIFRGEIIPELEKHGIHLIMEVEFTKDQRIFAKKYFKTNIEPHLKLQLIKEGQKAPFLENKELYFAIQFDDGPEIGILNIPTQHCERFIILPSDQEGSHYITFLDDLIRYNLPKFLNRKINQAYSIKVSRDAEMYLDEFEFKEELVSKLKEALSDRNTGLATRFLFDNQMPGTFLNQITEIFNLGKNDLIPGARYHNFNDFFGFPDPTKNEKLHNESLPPLPHPILENASSMIEEIRKRDLMLHFPYQRYDYVPQLIKEAADDPLVDSIKITLYRVASKSAVVLALLYALEKGKSVTAFIEAKARFDEESNIYWGEELEKAKAKVYYSFPGIKVHTKLLLISRKEADKPNLYAYLGTGNFNEKTAKLYCDHALLTADPRLATEVDQVFSILERKILIPKCKHLFVAPFSLRTSFSNLIDKEINNQQEGKEAYMILKMNSLEDPGMIKKLYQASNAGVNIQLIVRGICSLVPGVKGMSENIEVISIVDRFLEHARVYIFCNGGKEKMYTASADWMTRNLDRRIEVAIPILDPDVYQELREIINIQLSDNTKARLINTTQSNPYKMKIEGAKAVRSQVDTYRFVEGLLKESTLAS